LKIRVVQLQGYCNPELCGMEVVSKMYLTFSTLELLPWETVARQVTSHKGAILAFSLI